MDEALFNRFVERLGMLVTAILAQDAPNAKLFDGLTVDQVVTRALLGQAADAKLFNGLTVDEVVKLSTGGEATAGSVELALNEFKARRDNPNQVNAVQVGLGQVPNFDMASMQEALEGVDASSFMSPVLVAAVVEWAITSLKGDAPGSLDDIEKLAAALGNDPEIINTAFEQINRKLNVDGTALNSAKLGNLSADKFALVEDTDAGFNNFIEAFNVASLGLTAKLKGQLTIASYELMGNVLYGYVESSRPGAMGALTPKLYGSFEVVQVRWVGNELSLVLLGDASNAGISDLLIDDDYVGKLTETEYQAEFNETAITFDITGLTLPTTGTVELVL